jgi:hypothetical protein
MLHWYYTKRNVSSHVLNATYAWKEGVERNPLISFVSEMEKLQTEPILTKISTVGVTFFQTP